MHIIFTNLIYIDDRIWEFNGTRTSAAPTVHHIGPVSKPTILPINWNRIGSMTLVASFEWWNRPLESRRRHRRAALGKSATGRNTGMRTNTFH